MKFYIISGIFLLLGILTGADPSCKSSLCIDVDIYYEALCWDSVRFIKNQLAPSYPALKDYLHINFIPYGKATHKRQENGEWEFKCQHRKPEYDGNKAQACALNAIEEISPPESKQEHSVDLVTCVMSKNSPERAVKKCAHNIKLTKPATKEIARCMRSSDGDDLLAAHGDKTHSLQPRVQFIPTIVINGNYSHQQPTAAFYNFKKVICNLLKEGGEDLTYCAQFNRIQ